MPLPHGFIIRPATTADLEILVAHRRAMFQDMGYSDEAALNSMTARFRPWLMKHMNAGDYHAWLTVAADGTIAAGVGLWLMEWLPHMIGQGAYRGNILNVYTAGKFRRRGLARQLMEAVLRWCRENSIDTIILHASPLGRSLYESMGFSPSNEMRLHLATEAQTPVRNNLAKSNRDAGYETP
jgi:GNAT superfamily N-acetyltransferase